MYIVILYLLFSYFCDAGVIPELTFVDLIIDRHTITIQGSTWREKTWSFFLKQGGVMNFGEIL